MKTIDQMTYHPISERLVQILCNKTQNDNKTFFRVMISYYFCVMASMMRVNIKTIDRGVIPINLYALNLSGSGSGKGYSMSLMEEKLIHGFRSCFLENTLPLMAEQNIPKLAHKRANKKGTDVDLEIQKARKEFDNLGPLVFSFDSGTPAAVKQMRHQILMAELGAVNLQIDEIGSNLIGNKEVLTTFLELFDIGVIKQKLTKNTAENSRNEEIIGKTPTNMLLFGTPSKILNGSKIEDELYDMLNDGYARRCFFGFSKSHKKRLDLTPEEIYAIQTDPDDDLYLEQTSERFENLADILNANRTLAMTADTSLELIRYKLDCERFADILTEHAEARKAEMAHRYFKVLKLAGAYAFIDGSSEVTVGHLEQAIKVATDSGDAFHNLLTREQAWVRLARYLAEEQRPLTHAELIEALPFYKGSAVVRQEMLTLAISHGYRNNIIIKKSFEHGVEFLRGETLKKTDLQKMIVSWSTELAYNYKNEIAPWDKLHQMTQANGVHWVNHHVLDGHRQEEACIHGFNLIVIDVDKGDVTMAQMLEVFKDLRFLAYSTKRSTEESERFRLIFPMNNELKLDSKDYKEFMNNVFDWLPFKVDRATGQRAKKWLAHSGSYRYNDGELLDVLPFIPKTSKSDELRARLKDQSSFDNLERWFINNSGDGNRNNMLLRYGTLLVDGGLTKDQIQGKVLELNHKLDQPLEDMEIIRTVMSTVKARIDSLPPVQE